MGRLPPPTENLIARLQAAGRYLDHLADTAIDDMAHAVARANANTVWHAVDRLEELAELVEELAPPVVRSRRGEWLGRS